ncbi:biotin--protein ligase [Lates japonicus]|uniref:Biotin--protein ligase n=1 Tax=Lates japonicus TaxID=270547 RepID=A0AAD3QXI1_LATJO|nr:biotin--protein ligase [Lates japonicus]
MLITLCYVYLWVRFHKCYSVLIRNSLSRLNSSSFSFSVCSSSASAAATAPRSGHQTVLRRSPTTLPPEDIVFLQLGDKAVYVTEPKVGYRT